MSQEVERKFLTTSYHLAVVRTDEASPDLSHRDWLTTYAGATAISIAKLYQQYLSLRLEESRVVEEDRIRRKATLDEEGAEVKVKFTRTIKRGSGLSREELEDEIEEAEFLSLAQNTELTVPRTGKPPQIHKLRTTTEIGGRVLEIDRYLGTGLGGLCVTEIEFASEDQALEFEPSELPRGILGQELDPTTTGNAQLAMANQIPEEIEIILPHYLKPS